MSVSTDRWADWLRTRRTGGSEEARRATLERLAPVRDRILDDAEVGPGVTVLDVGCGDGLVGLGALDRGADVIFSDVSEACLDDCRAIAGDAARYHLASATDLGDVEADVVTTRSVLIYVDDKQRAFDEFFRILRPGGRAAIWEPINRFGCAENRRSFGGFHVDGVEELIEKLLGAFDERSENPMIDFDERDLFACAERAGFAPIRLELIAELADEPLTWTCDWDVFLNTAPNPNAPTLVEAMEATLTDDERTRLIARLRPQVERGEAHPRHARAFVLARKR
jgi:arsenite methyltransferase